MMVDSSFLIALSIPEHELHAAATKKRESLRGQKLEIPDRVIEETFTVLTYKKGITHGLDFLRKISANRDVKLRPTSPREVNETSELILKLEIRMSFVDYLVAYLSKLDGQEPLNFDKELMKAYEKIS